MPHSEHSEDDTIAIVGGGIGGLCTAIGLHTHDIPITIYEAAAEFSEIGAGVSLGPNASKAMKLLHPAVWKGYEKVRTNNVWPSHQKLWFTFRQGDAGSEYPEGKKIFEMACPTGQTSVHRASFLNELIALIPDGISHFGKRLVNITESPSNVVLHFADGTSARHSAVICCDGIKSTARPIVLGQDHPAAYPVFTGKYAYRGLIPMSLAIESIGPELAQNSQQYLGHGGHILTFPIENGKTLNCVAFSTAADPTQPRQDSSTKQHQKASKPNWITPTNHATLLSEFSSKTWSSIPLTLLSLMSIREKWSLYDHPPAPSYTSQNGLICLLGDAAHASTPHNGAGAGMAIEDALVISKLLGAVVTLNGERIRKAFRVYQEVRIKRTQKQVRTAREFGLVYDFQDPWAGDDLGRVQEKLERSKKWLWNYDIEKEEIERGIRRLGEVHG
ncbi:6-methylsalicylic acid decarboxylase atA [Pseudocercospora fuligena]|uniref:6-methylsalicylic acid decarboxylase atA n=1 Tax=Pseudocercospora fuligena TaxID=685502 RepID=A0A8H6RIG2_9PEZI|nr:6-methylsalicylic acid decarboxylase atA [Pseudocercospora fuligena]